MNEVFMTKNDLKSLVEKLSNYIKSNIPNVKLKITINVENSIAWIDITNQIIGASIECSKHGFNIFELPSDNGEYTKSVTTEDNVIVELKRIFQNCKV